MSDELENLADTPDSSAYEPTFDSSPDVAVDDSIVDDDAVVEEGDLEVAAASDPTLVIDDGKTSRNYTFNIFDAMLLVSLVFISLAVMLLVWKLGSFGSVFSSPWNPSEIGQ